MLAELSLRLHARCHRFGQRHLNPGISAGLDLLPAVVAAIGNCLQFVDAKHLLGPRGYVGKLRPIRAAIRHFVCDDEMVLGVDGDLHVVADDAGAAPARGHRTAVGIGERDLLVRRGQHLFLIGFEALHLACELGELLLEMRGLRCERFRWVLQAVSSCAR